MNAIAGRTEIEISGVRRELACDMNAAAVLFERYGEHWALWLIERFAGKPVKLPDGSKGRELEKLSPADLITVLYALLASDREDRRCEDSEKALRRSFGIGQYPELQAAVTRTVIAGFGIPGEAIEVAAGADAPRGSERAATPGTGTES